MKILMSAAVFSLIFLSGCLGDQHENLLNYNMQGHTNIALHIHPHLEIEILGQNETIPVNIGISASGMRVIHTHDSSGILHVESPVQEQFYLEDFFTIWGRDFNSTCIFGYCTNQTHELKIFVNDIEDNRFGKIPLKDKDRIRIVYSEILG